ncbi:MBL fold metallo-hydrolase [Mesorhizobium sp. KR9-304]|uniref:MBL fold metallo-hydrolase n=1 Tax=Mesorhizobium sp. KR9-304 TaxID=3156614 RepID=UPI0032B44C69
MALDFDLSFEPAYGEPVKVFPGVSRLTARNPGPFTFHGTNSYLVGENELAVIDPGPENDEHLDALIRAIGGRPVNHILVSHTHRDHSPLAARLSSVTGARTYAQGPHRAARNPPTGTPLDNGSDTAFMPDVTLADGDLLAGEGWALRTVLTPGHAANHAAFALEGAGLLFSADHVMAWSTTIVAPPDGSMSDYMASLDRLIERNDEQLLPGHGGPVRNPRDYLRGLKEHRLARERAIVARLRQGDWSIDQLVKAIYRDTDPRMHGAAGLSVLAHLEDLVDRKLVETDGAPSIGGIFRPV